MMLGQARQVDTGLLAEVLPQIEHFVLAPHLDATEDGGEDDG